MKTYNCDICECEWAEHEDGLQFGGKFERIDTCGVKKSFDLCDVCAEELEERLESLREACQ